MYPILLLHGALGAASLLRPLSQTWSTDYQVLTPDFPGHGSLAGHKESMTIKSLSDFLIQWMDEQGLSKVAVFGYSMGGYIALVSAFHRPNLFACIATLGTKFNWSPEIATQEMRKLNPEKILTKVPKFATMLTQRHGAANWQKVVNQTAHLMQDLGETPILTEDTLGQIQTPTHILLGDSDQMVSEEESQWASQHLPKGQFALLLDTPHPLEKVDPNLLYSTLAPFFQAYASDK